MDTADLRNHLCCPQCGAGLVKRGYLLYCCYCGFQSCTTHEEEETDHFSLISYWRKNLDYSLASTFVNVQIQSTNSAVFESKQPYSPYDSFYRVHKELKMKIRYVSTNRQESFSLIICTNVNSTPFLHFKIDGSIYDSPIEGISGGIVAFHLSIKSFVNLCFADEILIKTSLSDFELIGSDLSVYCKRFYNQVFNKNRFIYALHKKLVCES